MTTKICFAFAVLLAGTCAQGAVQGPVKNRAPLAANAFYRLPLTSVRPSGWLRDQLRLQAEGITGHLDEFWPDVGPNSAWLGGAGEGWERGPYYLDGLLPLAYLLDDPKLIAKAGHGWNGRSTHQPPTAPSVPPRIDDWWPIMIMLKVLTQYQEATGDPRVIPAMEKYFAYQLAHARRQSAAELGHLPLAGRTGQHPLALQPHRRLAPAGPGAAAQRRGLRLAQLFEDFPFPGKVGPRARQPHVSRS